MKKKKKSNSEKYGVLFIMVIMIVFAWYGVLGGSGKKEKLLMQYIAKAEEHEAKGAYITAVDCYLKALELEPENYDYMLKTAENYKNCDDRKGFFDYCDMAIENQPENDDAYIMKARYYLDNEKYADTINVLNSSPVMTEEMKEVLSEAEYSYRIYIKAYEDTYGFYGKYAAVMSTEGKWGIIDNEGDVEISIKYDAVGGYNKLEDIVPVCRDGEWYFADIDGNKKYVPDNDYSFIGTYREGFAPVCSGKKYGYIDLGYKEYHMEYDFAGTFSSGVAAVCKDGKWALIDTEFKNITDFIFDEITVDKYGLCEHGGIITAVKDGKNVYLDSHGKEVADSTIYFAGVTPYEKDGLWGYSSQSDDVIEAQFEEVTPFSDYGSAMVRTDEGWQVLRFYKYMAD